MKEFREWHRPIMELLFSEKCNEVNPLRALDATFYTKSKGHKIERPSVVLFLQHLNEKEGVIHKRLEKGRGGYHGVFWKGEGLEEYWAQSLKEGEK